MTQFRPCIDLHQGQVKQIVGSSLSDDDDNVQTNFISSHNSSWYAELYKKNGLQGGHVIMLGPGNESEALHALQAYPGGLQIGGGINAENAQYYLDQGASHVIVTSWIFTDDELDMGKLSALSSAIGKERLVLDLSCRQTKFGYRIATNRWQNITRTPVNSHTLELLAEHCEEFLVHAADVEGKQEGMDEELIHYLARFSPIRCTYAGGATRTSDLQRVQEISGGQVDLTIGSALDIFGGSGAKFEDCVKFNEGSRD